MAWEGDMRRLILAAAAALTLAVPANALGVGTVHDHRLERDGFDARAGAVAPSAAQRAKLSAPRSAGARPAASGSPSRIAFQVGARARVTVTVLRGRRVVERFKTISRSAGRTHRLRLAPARLRRGDYRVRVQAVRGSRRVTAVLVARRL